ncbi:DUF1566 domain-containing protein [Massilia aerilata]|uniref:DUF1566 domain-containing protein n=1 Tax=Massilia aerilata TaxID=453817 RepID=A0ABW0RU79_9BURK
MKQIGAWLLMMCLLAACSDPDQGPPLGPFAAITKTETDKPFNIDGPTSKSPAPFTYTSSNAAVATIVGSLVTIKGPGVSTITAAQAGTGGWGPTSASTTLTVTAVPCDNGGVRVNGQCVAVPACVAPATLVNNQCVPPASNANLVTANFLAWSGVSFADNWTKASAYCSSITIDGRDKWRQPSVDELKALQASGALDGQNWTLGNTWSSAMGTTTDNASHLAVNLSDGTVVERADTANAYVSCVR